MKYTQKLNLLLILLFCLGGSTYSLRILNEEAEVTGYEYKYQNGTEINITASVNENATLFLWTLECNNKSNIQNYQQNSNTTTLQISGTSIPVNSSCIATFLANSTSEQQLYYKTLYFDIVDYDPTTYVDINGYQNIFQSTQSVNITAVTPINSTNPQWLVKCTNNSDASVVFNQTYNTENFNISSSTYQFNTTCYANFTGLNNESTPISLYVSFNIEHYSNTGNNSNQTNNTNQTTNQTNQTTNNTNQTTNQTNQTTNQTNQTTNNTNYTSNNTNQTQNQTTNQTNQTTNNTNQTTNQTNQTPNNTNQTTNQTNTNNNNTVNSSITIVGLKQEYYSNESIILSTKLPQNLTKLNFTVVCVNRQNQIIFNFSSAITFTYISSGTFQGDANCEGFIYYLQTPNQSINQSFYFSVYLSQVIYSYIFDLTNGYKESYYLGDNINFSANDQQINATFMINCTLGSGQLVYIKTFNRNVFIDTSSFQNSTQCWGTFTGKNQENQTIYSDFYFSYYDYDEYSQNPDQSIDQYTTNYSNYYLVGKNVKFAANDSVVNATFQIYCLTNNDVLFNQTFNNSVNFKTSQYRYDVQCYANMKGLYQGKGTLNISFTFNIYYYEFLLVNYIYMTVGKYVNYANPLNITSYIQSMGDITSTITFVKCSNSKTYQGNQTLIIKDLVPNLFCTITVTAQIDSSIISDSSQFQTENNGQYNINLTAMASCKLAGLYYDVLLDSCISSCSSSEWSKYLYGKNGTCVPSCPPGSTVYEQEQSCVDICPKGSGVNKTVYYYLKEGRTQQHDQTVDINQLMIINSSNISLVCSACKQGCKSCSPLDFTKCFACEYGLQIERIGKCVVECPEYYTANLDTGKCEPCKQNCTACPDYLVLSSSGSCEETCAVDEYANITFAYNYNLYYSTQYLQRYSQELMYLFRNKVLLTDSQIEERYLTISNLLNKKKYYLMPLIEFNATCLKSKGPVFGLNEAITNENKTYTLNLINSPLNSNITNITIGVKCDKSLENIYQNQYALFSQNQTGSVNFTFNTSQLQNLAKEYYGIICVVNVTVQNSQNLTNIIQPFSVRSNQTIPKYITCRSQNQLYSALDDTCTQNCSLNKNSPLSTQFGFCLAKCPASLAFDADSNTCVRQCSPQKGYSDGQCIICSSQKLLKFFDLCVATCPKGYTNSNGTCEVDKNSLDYKIKLLQYNCSAQNKYADLVLMQCVKNCSTTQYLNANQSTCVKQCPDNLVTDETTRNCSYSCSYGSIFFQPLKKCFEKIENCLYINPMYSLSCTQCGNQTFFVNSTESCVVNCSEGYVADNSTKLCVPKCEFNCIKCGDFQALYNGACVDTCPTNTNPFVVVSPLLQSQISKNDTKFIVDQLTQKLLPTNTNKTILTYRELGIPLYTQNPVSISCKQATAPKITLAKFRSSIPQGSGFSVKAQIESTTQASSFINISCAYEGQIPYYTNQITSQTLLDIPQNKTLGGSQCTVTVNATNSVDSIEIKQTINIVNIVSSSELQQLIAVNSLEIQSSKDPLGIDVSRLFESLKSLADGLNDGEITKATPLMRIALLIYDLNNTVQNKISLPSTLDQSTVKQISTFVIPAQLQKSQFKLSIQIAFDIYPDLVINIQSGFVTLLPVSLDDVKTSLLAQQQQSVEQIKQKPISDMKSLAASLELVLGKSTPKVNSDLLDANGQIDQQKYQQQQDQTRKQQKLASLQEIQNQKSNKVQEVTCQANTCNGNGECSVIDKTLLACKCNDGWKGTYCSINATVFEAAKSLVSNVASALKDKQLTAADVSSVIDTITSLTSEKDTVTESAALDLAATVDNAANIYGKDVKPPTEVVSQLVGATDNILGVTKNQFQNQKIKTSGTDSAAKPTQEQINQLRSTVTKAISSIGKLLDAVAVNLDANSKETKTVVSSYFNALFKFADKASNSGRLRRLQTANYITLTSTSDNITVTIRIPQSAISAYNNIIFKNQLWYVNNREVLDSSTSISTFIVQPGLYSPDSKDIIPLSSNDKDIEIDIPLLVNGQSDSTYNCLNWKVSGDGTQKWSNDSCVQKKVTTTYVTCACSSLGEHSASVIVSEPQNQNQSQNNAAQCLFDVGIKFILIGFILLLVLTFN